jgi:photosynthetic reaction center cytochrome c subunit
MRQLLFVLAICATALFAQDAPPAGRGAGGGRGAGAPHTNLKVLTEAEFAGGAMRMATTGLGVMCDDCHVTGNRAADDKPMKVTARMMFAMVKDLNAKFPDGKMHVTCYTCHRGVKEPLTAPPAAQ